MSNLYYREKLIFLVEKLFTHTGDAKSKFIENERYFESVIIAAKSGQIDQITQDRWNVIWKDLNSKEELVLGTKLSSSFTRTINSKRNNSLKKYLDFILEEFYKVI
jgi:hypothetical protein